MVHPKVRYIIRELITIFNDCRIPETALGTVKCRCFMLQRLRNATDCNRKPHPPDRKVQSTRNDTNAVAKQAAAHSFTGRIDYKVQTKHGGSQQHD